MNRHPIRKSIVAICLIAVSGSAALAAQQAPSFPTASGMPDMSKHHPTDSRIKRAEGGMGDMGDMMGMMKMMNSCQSMMDDAQASSSALMLKLPPGNEKLEFKMRAEMMQKMGQIASQYADKIREAR